MGIRVSKDMKQRRNIGLVYTPLVLTDRVARYWKETALVPREPKVGCGIRAEIWFMLFAKAH